VAQNIHDQEEAGEEEEAEPPYSSLDPHEDRQHHQVQCEAQALASYQARILRRWIRSKPYYGAMVTDLFEV
ncbi:hypothetical protein RJ641_025491, partial [Dillenia turbinata]